MRIRFCWKAILIAVVCAAVVLGVAGNRRRVEARTSAEPAPKLTPFYVGAKLGCGTNGCHGAPPSEEPLLCRCTEYTIWDSKDKHVDAYKVLSGERGKQMGKLLGYDVASDPRCLSCHGAVVADEKAKHKTFTLDDGVSCSICHGPYKEWYTHGLPVFVDDWRKMTPREKEAKYGMTDLWDPAKRTALCASCHQGNKEQGKFVTHEMYAAGHPPLPSFEVATFSDQMPRHWQYRREKPKKVQDLLKYDGVDREQTKLILVGAAVTLRESMRLLVEECQECIKATDADRKSLDYAHFDCYACHHDLKSPSWRQKRGYSGKPGRVPRQPWPTVLIPLVIPFAAGDDRARQQATEEFEARVKALDAAFDAQPFGDPARIETAARALQQWASTLAERVNDPGKVCDDAAARAFLAALPVQLGKTNLDYDSARQ